MKNLRNNVKFLIFSIVGYGAPLSGMNFSESKESARVFAVYVKNLFRVQLSSPVRAYMYAVPEDEDVKLLNRYIDVVFENYLKNRTPGKNGKMESIFKSISKKEICKDNLKKILGVSTIVEVDNRLDHLGATYNVYDPCLTWNQFLGILTERIARKMEAHSIRI